MVASIANVLPNTMRTDATTVALRSALDVLGLAPSQTAVAPLKCFIGAIYADIVIINITSAIASLKVSVKRDIARANAQCSNAAGRDLKSAIDSSMVKLDNAATSLSAVMTSVGECITSLSDTEGEETGIQAVLSNFSKNADNGCSETVTVESVELPACYMTSVTKYSKTSVAGDGTVDACEIFSSCVSGSCSK